MSSITPKNFEKKLNPKILLLAATTLGLGSTLSAHSNSLSSSFYGDYSGASQAFSVSEECLTSTNPFNALSANLKSDETVATPSEESTAEQDDDEEDDEYDLDDASTRNKGGFVELSIRSIKPDQIGQNSTFNLGGMFAFSKSEPGKSSDFFGSISLITDARKGSGDYNSAMNRLSTVIEEIKQIDVKIDAAADALTTFGGKFQENGNYNPDTFIPDKKLKDETPQRKALYNTLSQRMREILNQRETCKLKVIRIGQFLKQAKFSDQAKQQNLGSVLSGVDDLPVLKPLDDSSIDSKVKSESLEECRRELARSYGIELGIKYLARAGVVGVTLSGSGMVAGSNDEGLTYGGRVAIALSLSYNNFVFNFGIEGSLTKNSSFSGGFTVSSIVLAR